ncbi:MAG: glycosyltransferase family 2 protein [Acidobacteria bacterium]|nr:glycosyltransferase family 2 protein [Acidobacteriota bacterium]
MNDIDLSIIIPFYNDALKVKFVLDSIIQVFTDTGIRFEVIPVDNGSADRTPEIIQACSRENKFLCPLSVESNRGLGWVLRKGFEQARGTYICYYGGDGQTSPLDVFNMYQLLSLSKENDMIFGRRLRSEAGFGRNAISKIFNYCFRVLYCTKLHDINGTPKIFKAERLFGYRWKSEGRFIHAELILFFLKMKLKIQEYPVWFDKRKKSEIPINTRTIFEFINNMLYFFFLGRKYP